MKAFVALIFCVSIVQMVIALTAGAGDATGMTASILHIVCAFAVYAFHGGASVTPLGMAALASGYLLGLAYPCGLLQTTYELHPIHNVTAVVCLYGLCGTALVAMCIAPQKCFDMSANPPAYRALAEESVAARLLLAGILFLSFGWLVSQAPGLWGRFNEPAMFAAFVAFTLIAVSQFAAGRWIYAFLAAPLAVSAFVSYYYVCFIGFGRLRIAALGFVALMIVTLFKKSMVVRLAPVAFSPLFLIWAGMVRSRATTFSFSVLTEAKGLGSLFGSFTTLADILEKLPVMIKEGSAHLLYGASYLYDVTFWVPRVLWPRKPMGLGHQYVVWLCPDYALTGHSLAGSYIGEAYANFGVVGICLAPLIAGVIVGCISRYSIGLMTSGVRGRGLAVYLFIVYVILSASIADFVWADTNTFTQRALVRMAVWTIGWSIVWFLTSLAAPEWSAADGTAGGGRVMVRARPKRW